DATPASGPQPRPGRREESSLRRADVLLPGRREVASRRLRGSSDILRSEQGEQAQLATVVVDPGRSEADAHHRRCLLDAELVKEDQVQHSPLPGGELAERAPDSRPPLLGGERIEGSGVRVLAWPDQEPPGRVPLQPPPPPSPGGDVAHHREEPGLDGGAPTRPGPPP